MSLQMLAALLTEEMAERKWTSRDVAIRRVMHDFQCAELELDMILALADDPRIARGHAVAVNNRTLGELDKAFDVSDGFFQRIYESSDPAGREYCGAKLVGGYCKRAINHEGHHACS